MVVITYYYQATIPAYSTVFVKYPGRIAWLKGYPVTIPCYSILAIKSGIIARYPVGWVEGRNPAKSLCSSPSPLFTSPDCKT